MTTKTVDILKEIFNHSKHYPTFIRRCIDCKVKNDCEGEKYKIQGYCYTGNRQQADYRNNIKKE